jgi:hypothetical protein
MVRVIGYSEKREDTPSSEYFSGVTATLLTRRILARFCQWHWSRAKMLQTEDGIKHVSPRTPPHCITPDNSRSISWSITPFITHPSSKHIVSESSLSSP